MGSEIIWIGHTTRYREGGPRFAQVARTLAKQKRHAGHQVRQTAVESKADFRREMATLAGQGLHIDELHFVGHSGMYGIMFGSREWPEQFSRHEWQTLSIPFAPGAEAYFHACRSARWFAPFFANQFKVPTSGFFWYTTFSRSHCKYAWVHQRYPNDAPLYVFGCPGKKSHGLLGSARKYAGLTQPEPLQRFKPQAENTGASYDNVASLYNHTFKNIQVRRDEWIWLSQQLSGYTRKLDVLDIGCGNGALLSALANRLRAGIGVDASRAMLDHARENNAAHPHISFVPADGPALPAADNSIDIVISLLSFRYLDWDPTLKEIQRVLKPGGRFLVIDMVARPADAAELARVFLDKFHDIRHRRRFPGYANALGAMVNDNRWATMLKYNPIRSDHEFSWYLKSRFPAGRFATLNLGMNARVVAFDSGASGPW